MPQETRIPVRLQPRGRKDEIVGWREDRLLLRVTAPPVDGRANVALCRLLDKRLGVPRGDVDVVHGHANRDKLVAVSGLDGQAVAAALPPRAGR